MTVKAIRASINGNFKWVALLLPFIVAGLVAFANVKVEIGKLETKTDIQYQAILRELQQINQRLDRMP